MKRRREEKLDVDHEEIDSLISDINSMVVNISTSSVPNISELAMENGKTLSLHPDQLRLMKDSPLSQSCQANIQLVGIDNKNQTNAKQQDDTKVEEKETHPKRWSLKVEPTMYQWLTIPAGRCTLNDSDTKQPIKFIA